MMTVIKNSFSKTIACLIAIIMACAMAVVPRINSHAEQIEEDQLKEMANELSFLINEVRAEAGLAPMYVVPYLNDVATVRAREAIFSFDHIRPDGTKFSTAFDENLVPYSVIFENLAAGCGTPEQTMEQWKNSPKHLAAILNPEVTHMGIGVGYEQNSYFKWYWETNFIITDEHFANEYIPQEYVITPQAEGDITGDAVIDTFDYLALADYIYKTKNNIPVYLNEAQLETADCFRDGIITESDAKVMVRYMLGEYTELPFIF